MKTAYDRMLESDLLTTECGEVITINHPTPDSLVLDLEVMYQGSARGTQYHSENYQSEIIDRETKLKSKNDFSYEVEFDNYGTVTIQLLSFKHD